jgi:hypothetical protein
MAHPGQTSDLLWHTPARHQTLYGTHRPDIRPYMAHTGQTSDLIWHTPARHQKSGTHPHPVHSLVCAQCSPLCEHVSWRSLTTRGQCMWEPSQSGGDLVCLQPQIWYVLCVLGTVHLSDLKPVPLCAPDNKRTVQCEYGIRRPLPHTSRSTSPQTHVCEMGATCNQSTRTRAHLNIHVHFNLILLFDN